MTSTPRSISPDRAPETYLEPLSLPRPLKPFAARLHRLAAFITENDLPAVALHPHADGTIIGLSFDGVEQPENALRRWAQALEVIVTESPCDMPDGTAGEQLHLSGYHDGIFWTGSIARPVLAVTA